MSLRVIAPALGGAFLAVSGIVWVLASGRSALAILAGGGLPIAISVISLYVFQVAAENGESQRHHDSFVAINFLVKVILIGLWMVLILLATTLPRIPFVVSLLVNFFTWHVYEAYRYQAYLQAVTTGAKVS